MAAPLLVTSIGQAAGKSALCVGLGKALQKAGMSPGYYKPRFSQGPTPHEPDPDAVFIRKVLSLEESVESISPWVGTFPSEPEGELHGAIKQSYEKASKGKVITLVEGPGSLDDARGKVTGLIAEALDAKVLVVAKYSQGMDGGSIAPKLSPLGSRLVGVVINNVPPKVSPLVKPLLEAPLSNQGITVLGFLSENRALFGFSVGELAEHLGGEFLCRPERSGDLIENLIIGANPADPALEYFTPKPNKAVFCRSDRPDIQLATLDTQTRCLVLTGTGQHQKSLIYRADDLGVPVIRVATDTVSTIANLDGLIQKVRFRQEGKVPVIQKLLEEGLDLPALYAVLGVS